MRYPQFQTDRSRAIETLISATVWVSGFAVTILISALLWHLGMAAWGV